MDGIVIVGVFVGSTALAVAAARGILTCVFHLMVHPPAFALHFRFVTFVVALFWFWYLAPIVAAHLR
jgi:hypothetical protein